MISKIIITIKSTKIPNCNSGAQPFRLRIPMYICSFAQFYNYYNKSFLFTGVEILRSFTRKMVLFGNQSDILAPVLIAEHRHRNIYGQSK